MSTINSIQALKKYREDHLISKSELARKAGLSPQTIERVENGGPCRMDTLRKIVQSLGIPFDELNINLTD
ncbi:MAG: helix-turn-helix domain-containing protein [Deltaproteobacteria bacterium]|jgi:DNA-binding XRE family transcriptional regulator|nr:helix-turn-helix domain-containing protein [Deltaproteobacteria bacterium]MDR1297956.1 helix-turn-helix domain-containing protein [Deltaproteobacteria bacterium]